jgi:hypothetical protein
VVQGGALGLLLLGGVLMLGKLWTTLELQEAESCESHATFVRLAEQWATHTTASTAVPDGTNLRLDRIEALLDPAALHTNGRVRAGRA